MSNDHWPQFYHQHHQSPPAIFSVAGDAVSDSTVVTTSAPTPTTSTLSTTHLSGPEGRVAKPIRRRSRASRRTPTTLLNTDTTNFRAMVQQFTGGPSAPFGTTSSQGFSFAMNSQQGDVFFQRIANSGGTDDGGVAGIVPTSSSTAASDSRGNSFLF
ncbi:VQ motif-containing protein [Euphorbia peplus]|nr:VQ motif-containing protein [Euphorbia peplus]